VTRKVRRAHEQLLRGFDGSLRFERSLESLSDLLCLVRGFERTPKRLLYRPLLIGDCPYRRLHRPLPGFLRTCDVRERSFEGIL
jgi:hypothetical protein